MNDATREYEFESVGESTIRETWRASAPADLKGDDLAHFLEDEMREGRAEFVDESNEEENGRELVEGSIEPAPPRPEPAYSLLGRYEGKAVSVAVYTFNGPEAALDLAQDAWGEQLEIRITESVEVVAIAAGEVQWIDFDDETTWPQVAA
jgi:hypothetical protein